MTNHLDLRRIRVTISVGGGPQVFQENLAIVARGTKYVNPLQNECEIQIFNLNKQTQDFILTETSPYNLNNGLKSILLEAGRESYGLATIFFGDIVASSVSQPPDIGITLRCLTGNYLKSNVIAINFGVTVPLEQVSARLAQQANLALLYQASNINIANYAYNGNAYDQVSNIGGIGNVDAYIDDKILVVKNKGQPLNNRVRELNAGNGMVGIPEFTEWGVRVKYLIDNISVIGGALKISSAIYPAINGTYIIYKLGFEIATWDTPFYYVAETTINGLFPPE